MEIARRRPRRAEPGERVLEKELNMLNLIELSSDLKVNEGSVD